MRLIDPPPMWSSLVRIVSDVEDEELVRFFSDDELKVVREFRLPLRRRQWAATRIALKLLATGQRLCASPFDCRVDSHSKRPLLVMDGEIQDFHVSLSHSAGAGAAALAPFPVGLDLQEVREVEPRVTKFFLNEPELRSMESLSIRDRLIHFWAAKEAVWKVEPGEGWYRSATVSLRSATPVGLQFDYVRGGTSGEVATIRLAEPFVLALARKRT